MKKGDASVIVVILITLIVFLIMLTQLFPEWRKGLQEQTDFEGCSADLYLEAIEHKLTGGTKLIEAGCKIDQVTLSREKLKPYENLGKRKNEALAGAALTEWAIKAFVADKMAECFDTVWQGKEFLVEELANEAVREDEGISVSPSFNLNHFGCIFCARIELDDELKQMFPNPIPLWDWLNDNKLFVGESYADHFTKRNPDFYRKWLKGTSTFYTGRPIMVMFASKYTFEGEPRGLVGLYNYNTVHSNLEAGLPAGLLQSLKLKKSSIPLSAEITRGVVPITRVVDPKYGNAVCGFSLGTL